MVDSSKKIEIMGATKFSPGILNQTAHINDKEILKIIAFKILLSSKRDNK